MAKSLPDLNAKNAIHQGLFHATTPPQMNPMAIIFTSECVIAGWRMTNDARTPHARATRARHHDVEQRRWAMDGAPVL